MICIKAFLVLSTITSARSQSLKETNTELKHILDEYILCRQCGSDISSALFIDFVKSPESRYAFNETLFGKKVLVQVLTNGFILDFPVITVTHSNCVSVGEWEENDSWFPGYKWKICACPDCGDYLGWLFEPVNPKEWSAKPFVGLILPSLIGEYFTDSLIKYPELKSTN